MNRVGLVPSAPSCIQVRSGRMFDVLNPDPARIAIEDIASSLAKQCRFNGHTRSFYSVAQHSCLVSYLVPEQHALWGLLHDAAEAYIGDIVRPLKAALDDLAPGVAQGLETRIEAAIAVRFGLSWPAPAAEIKDADNRALATEKRDLMARSEQAWADLPPPVPYRIKPWGWSVAETMFLHRFRELTGHG